MNKKFSTLVGCLALGSAFSAAVAAGGVNSANGHYEFRKADVMAAPTSTPVKKIDAQKWYQLKAYDPATKTYGVLVHVRDFNTGKVFLRVVPAEEAPLLTSLWRIDYGNTDGLSGGKYRFINKETNVALMYDNTFAYDSKGESKDATWASAMVDGCVTRWAWYQGNTQSTDFEQLAPYAYFNSEKDSVMIMKADADGFVSAYKDIDENILANGSVIASNALEIQPVLANEIVLDSYAFNSMIEYNKQSAFDDKKAFGRFRFYEPNGKLINPDEKAFEGSAMQKTMNYEAQDGDAENEFIQQFFTKAVEDLEGVDTPAEYGSLIQAVEDAKDKIESINGNIRRINWNLSNVWQSGLKDYEAQVSKWTLLEKERKSANDAAYGKATALVSAIEGQKEVWDAFENGSLGMPGKLPGYTEAETKYSIVIKAYKKAIAEKDYSNIALQAIGVYEAASELINNQVSGNWGDFLVAKNNFKALVNITDAEKNAMSSYHEAVKGITEGEEGVRKFSSKVEEFEGLLATEEGKLKDAEKVLADAEKVLANATGAWEKTRYLLSNKFMRLKYIANTADLTKNKEYLMVDTAYWQNTVNPKEGDLRIVNSEPNKGMPKGEVDPLLISARYFFKLTYHPSQDSVVVEPLNASDRTDGEAKAGTSFRNSYAGQYFVYGSDIDDKASQASNSWTSTDDEQIALRLKFLNTSKWCLTAAATDLEYPLNARIAFDNPYDYLKRATLNTGLYFIQSTNKNGKYVVANLNGDLMYDVQNGDQEFNWMPSTMFVVEKMGCEGGDLIEVRNREYGVDWRTAFEGQLYHELDENGKPTGNMFTINYQDYGHVPSPELDTESNKLFVKDTYKFIPVTNEYALTNVHHGYKFLDPETLPYSNYAFRYNRYNAEGEYMNVSSEDYLKVSTGADAYYELATSYYEPAGEGVRKEIRVASQEFGYGAGVIDANSGKKLPQLVRQAYTLKVKDNNLVDNDTTYVGVNNVFGEKDYFVARGISDILDNNQAGMAMFYLKIDQFDAQGDTCYALINTLNKGYATHFTNGYQRANVLSTGHVGEEDLFNTQEDNIDAFALVTNDRPLYRAIDGNEVSFFRTVGGVDQKLFEDATNQTGASKVVEGFGYLGLAQEKMVTNGTDKWIVDPWTVSNARMPQYMFALKLDSIADGFWCKTNTHGYFADRKAADAADENHYVFYNGYTEGRFLVNLADSVVKGSHAYHNPDLYTFNGRAVRLGFVEGVHMYISADEAKQINEFLDIDKTALAVKAGEYFFTPINGNTIADLKNDEGYLIPELLFNVKKLKNDVDNVSRANFADKAGHNDWTFSLRLMNDDPENFFIESNLDGVSNVGSMKGAWIKIDNNCPVLNYISGNHVTITAEDLTPDNVTDGQLFTLTASQGGSTANEEIATSEVTVIAGEGQLTIANAAGKKVVVSNILGQVVVNTVLASDNATIAAPQGVVVVAVEGEEAVKAIVK